MERNQIHMLIPFSECLAIMKAKNIPISGILHIGAHDCEEYRDYLSEGISPNSIFWIDAIQEKVDRCRNRGIPNVYCQAIDNREGEDDFYITNNGQSSSLLELGTHATSYPHITVTEIKRVKLTTLKNWIETNSIPIQACTFWNLDIQGKELEALKSAGEYLKHANAIYTEVNTEHVYKDCGLMSEIDAFLKGFGFKRVKEFICNEGWGDALYLKLD